MYNPLFPQNYQPINYSQIPNYGNSPNYNQQPNNHSVVWVQGIEGAKAYPVMAGSDGVVLFDSDSDRFFIKSADQSGMPRMRVFDYHEVTNQPKQNNEIKQVDMSGYVTKEELEERLKELAPKKTTKKKEVKNDAE